LEGRWLRALPAAVLAAFGDFGLARVLPAALAAFALVTFDFAIPVSCPATPQDAEVQLGLMHACDTLDVIELSYSR
jgi:hypothetical protein